MYLEYWYVPVVCNLGSASIVHTYIRHTTIKPIFYTYSSYSIWPPLQLIICTSNIKMSFYLQGVGISTFSIFQNSSYKDTISSQFYWCHQIHSDQSIKKSINLSTPEDMRNNKGVWINMKTNINSLYCIVLQLKYVCNYYK